MCYWLIVYHIFILLYLSYSFIHICTQPQSFLLTLILPVVFMCNYFIFFETEPENPFYLLFWCGFILLMFSLLRIVSAHCYVAACLEYYSRSSREVMLLHGIYFWVIVLHINFQISTIYNMMHGMRYCRQKRCLNQNCNKKKKNPVTPDSFIKYRYIKSYLIICYICIHTDNPLCSPCLLQGKTVLYLASVFFIYEEAAE